MTRFLTLLALALLAAAEVTAVIWLAEQFGPLGALSVVGLDVFLGIYLFGIAARSVGEQRGWRMAAAAVIALPGLVLDLVGLALYLPSVQQFVIKNLRNSAHEAFARQGVSVVTVTDATGMPKTAFIQGDVIAGEVVDISDDDLTR